MNNFKIEQLIKDAAELKAKALFIISKIPPPVSIKVPKYEWYVISWNGGKNNDC